ncbi:MAG: hypothetical protein FWE12_02640 [Oscillospiraceae bacterium]|nr:hypothetical protein [Oscillospiraceae bacterium]
MGIRTRLVAGCLVLVVLLSGCGMLIEGTHLDVRPHQVTVTPDLGTGDYITVNSQQELERAIWGMVLSRVERGLFRIPHLQPDDAAEMVDAVVQEIWLRPLAAYAVSTFMPVLTEGQGATEMEMIISFQKSAAQIAGVRTVNTHTSASALLGQMLRNGEPYLAMLSPANIANVAFLESLIRDYYYSRALEVVLLPHVMINLYPSSGSGNQRIAEIVLDFGFEPHTLAQMRDDLRRAATDLVREIPEGLTEPQQVIWLAEILAYRVNLVAMEKDGVESSLPSIADTAFGALVSLEASSDGIAMALQAVFALLNIEAQMVRGELDDLPHAWNLLYFEGYYYHIDASMLRILGPGYTLFVPDEVMMFQNGYNWDTVLYPRADSLLRFDDFVG